MERGLKRDRINLILVPQLIEHIKNVFNSKKIRTLHLKKNVINENKQKVSVTLKVGNPYSLHQLSKQLET